MPSITLTVTDEDWAEYKKNFLFVYPNLTLGTEDEISDNAWIRCRFVRLAQEIYQRGVIDLFRSENKPVINRDIVT